MVGHFTLTTQHEQLPGLGLQEEGNINASHFDHGTELP